MRVITEIETRGYLLEGGIGWPWYYKADAAPYNDKCYSPSEGRRTLLDLRPNTPYTFSAYSDSACTGLLVTAETFTIRQLEPLPQCRGIAIRQEFEGESLPTNGPVDVVISNETDIPVRNVEIELFRLGKGSGNYKNSLAMSTIRIVEVNPEGEAPDIAFTAHPLSPVGLPTTLAKTIIVDLPEIPANSTYKLSGEGDMGDTLTELNAVLTVSSGGDKPVAVCRSHDSTWVYAGSARIGPAHDGMMGDFLLRTTVDDPLPATDGNGSVNFKISISKMRSALLKSCVKLDISSGLTQTGSVSHTPSTGTGDIMEYEDDGTDDYKRGYLSTGNYFRRGLCSGADGSYSGGIYHVGFWSYHKRTTPKWHQWILRCPLR